jgi:hypothetical protein
VVELPVERRCRELKSQKAPCGLLSESSRSVGPELSAAVPCQGRVRRVEAK